MNRNSAAKIMAAVRSLSAVLAAEGVTHRIRVDIPFEQWPEFRTMLAPYATGAGDKVGDYFTIDAGTTAFLEWRRPPGIYTSWPAPSKEMGPTERERIFGRILPDLTADERKLAQIAPVDSRRR